MNIELHICMVPMLIFVLIEVIINISSLKVKCIQYIAVLHDLWLVLQSNDLVKYTFLTLKLLTLVLL